MTLDSKIPDGPLEREVGQPQVRRSSSSTRRTSAASRSSSSAPVWPARRRPRASASSATSVKVITFHDSPRRAHSIAAQGGINAAKNYKNDGDSVYRLFYDTMKGGDYRAREANVYRLAQVSVDIIDQCVAQGVPFAREYGGLLDNRSFGGAQVSRTFYARGQTGQQLLLGAYQALMRQVHVGQRRRCYPRTEMLDLVVKDGRDRRHRVPRPRHRRGVLDVGPRGRARDRRLRQRLLPLDEREELERHRGVARGEEGRVLRQPLLHADPPHVHPGERRLPVEAHADVGVAAQRRPRLGAEEDGRHALARPDPRGRPRLLPRAPLPRVRQPRAARRRVARDQARGRRRPRRRAAEERRVPRLRGVDRAARPATSIEERYGNLFEMYERITDEDPYVRADAHLPRRPLHDGRALGRLQPDEQPARAVRARRGELLRPRREPARRVGAHAGSRRRLLRAAVHDRRLPRAAARRRSRCRSTTPRSREAEQAVDEQVRKMLSINGQRRPSTTSTASSARSCGTTAAWRAPSRASRRRSRRSPRSARSSGRTCACSARTRRATSRSRRPAASPTSSSSASCWCSTRCTATRVCGGHFREEYQTDDGEALRDDEHFAYVAAWEFKGVGDEPELHKEPLEFEYVHPSTRSYK